jgi:hypothetical protein
LLTAEALLRSAAGDPGHALALIDDVLRRDPSPGAESLQRSLERRLRPRAGLTLEWWEDSDDRRTIGVLAFGESHWLRSTELRLDAGVRQHSAPGYEDSLDTSFNLSTRHPFNAIHSVQADLGGHFYQGPGQDTASGLARWNARWSDRFNTGLAGQFEPAYTVQALAEDIRFQRYQADATWLPADRWNLRFVARFWQYTDDNQRVDALAQATYDLPWTPNLQALYRLTYADTRLDVPAYYSPQALVQNQLGLGYRWTPSPRITWRLQYLPGYGYERNEDGRWVQAVHTDLLLRNAGPFDLRPSFDYQQTPTYHMWRALLTLEHAF